MNKKEKNKLLKKLKDFSRRVRGIQREEHFLNGGTLEEWRGKSNIEVDRKKEMDKKRCREKDVESY